MISALGSQHVYLVLDFMQCDLRQYLDARPEATAPATIQVWSCACAWLQDEAVMDGPAA